MKFDSMDFVNKAKVDAMADKQKLFKADGTFTAKSVDILNRLKRHADKSKGKRVVIKPLRWRDMGNGVFNLALNGFFDYVALFRHFGVDYKIRNSTKGLEGISIIATVDNRRKLWKMVDSLRV